MWYRSENQIELVMIRHGITPSNKEHRYLGRTDEGLCPEGKRILAERKHNYPNVDYLFASPMKRCRESAEILYPNQDIIIIPEWVEMNFGDFEGKNHLELEGNLYYQKWIDSNGSLPFPGGESRGDFAERCTRGFYKMLEHVESLSYQDHAIRLGMILHGGTIMSLMSTFLGGEYFDYQVANGQGYLCRLINRQGCPQIIDMQQIL